MNVVWTLYPVNIGEVYANCIHANSFDCPNLLLKTADHLRLCGRNKQFPARIFDRINEHKAAYIYIYYEKNCLLLVLSIYNCPNLYNIRLLKINIGEPHYKHLHTISSLVICTEQRLMKSSRFCRNPHKNETVTYILREDLIL